MLNLLSLTASCLASPRLFFALLSPPLPLPDDGTVCKCWLSIIALCGPTVTKCVWLNWPRRRRRSRVGVKKPERHPFAWCLVFLLSSVLCLLSWVLTLESVCHAKCRSASSHKCSQDPHFGWWSCRWRRWWWCLCHWGTVSKNCLQLFIEIYVNCPKKKVVQICATISIYSRALSYFDLKWNQ